MSDGFSNFGPIIHYFVIGIALIAAVILFIIIMAAGVFDNIRQAAKKKGENSIEAKRSKVLNIVSAAVLMIPIILAVMFFVIS